MTPLVRQPPSILRGKQKLLPLCLGDILRELTCPWVLGESGQDALETRGQDNDLLVSMTLVQGPVSNLPTPRYDDTQYFFLLQSHGGLSFPICWCIKGYIYLVKLSLPSFFILPISGSVRVAFCPYSDWAQAILPFCITRTFPAGSPNKKMNKLPTKNPMKGMNQKSGNGTLQANEFISPNDQ